ncbi:glutamine amidotransferase [Streptodolium elevatio]|uniref:glutamine--fructose-6-phosphate transaminase (isomerizing) n=1 Tax=Streptodolium elevatio TaxID=3157996 RepID=A0ABV3D9T5_9ACTN
MCGIVGLHLRDRGLHARLGTLLSDMLGRIAERGPDSAGIGLYGDTATGAGQPAYTAGDFTVYKGVGPPAGVAASIDLARRTGHQGLAHTRMATESAVTAAHCHPFTPGGDLALVHNGSFANHATIRRALVRDGVRFDTDNDSEVAAHFIASSLADGDNLEKALGKVCETFDGFFTLLATTATQFAVVRDVVGGKPLLIAETEAYVAVASEYRALAGLPGIDTARVFEPAPEEVHLWSR